MIKVGLVPFIDIRFIAWDTNILGIIANWGRRSEMEAIKLPNIMSRSKTFENILSKRALEWPVILLGFKTKGVN